jgi:hypothetical protein
MALKRVTIHLQLFEKGASMAVHQMRIRGHQAVQS